MVIERANALGIDPPLIRLLGRTPSQSHKNEKFEDLWGERVQSGIHIVRCVAQGVQLNLYAW